MAIIKNNPQKITPCLWFNDNAEEAVNFYAKVFKEVEKEKISYYGEDGPMPKGSVLTIQFTIDGLRFLALNGGPHFQFSEAISFVINCMSQAEIDYYWEKLAEGGTIQQCGWLKDKFGLSWQVVPWNINELMTDKDPEKSSRVMAEIMKMKKLDMKVLENAYAGLLA